MYGIAYYYLLLYLNCQIEIQKPKGSVAYAELLLSERDKRVGEGQRTNAGWWYAAHSPKNYSSIIFLTAATTSSAFGFAK